MALTSTRSKRWEELVAVGMDDNELARLNRLNSRDPEDAHWDGMRLIYGGVRHI
jgi:hypothetical protein